MLKKGKTASISLVVTPKPIISHKRNGNAAITI